MKLGALNASIRKCKHVRVPLRLPNGLNVSVLVQKTDLIKQLQEGHDKDRGAETELDLVDGVLTGPEADLEHEVAGVEPDELDLLLASAPVAAVDLDDLLS